MLALPGLPLLAAERKQESESTKDTQVQSEPVKNEPAKKEAVENGRKNPQATAERQNDRARQEPPAIEPVSSRPRAASEFRGPDVTLIAGEERTIYEYRHNGQLRMIKVVPKFGKPYYLAPRDPTRGFGDLEQADSLIAEWVLWEF